MKQITLKNIIIRITVIVLSCVSGLNAYAAPEASTPLTSWPDEYTEITSSLNELFKYYKTLTIGNTITLDLNIDNIKTLSTDLFNETFPPLLPILITKCIELFRIYLINPNVNLSFDAFTNIKRGVQQLTLLNKSFANLLENPLTTDADILKFISTNYAFNLGAVLELLNTLNKLIESLPLNEPMESLPETLKVNPSALILP